MASADGITSIGRHPGVPQSSQDWIANATTDATRVTLVPGPRRHFSITLPSANSIPWWLDASCLHYLTYPALMAT